MVVLVEYMVILGKTVRNTKGGCGGGLFGWRWKMEDGGCSECVDAEG